MSNSALSLGYRRLFYLVLPNETSYEKLEDVPGYVEQAFPFFVSLIIIECLILFLQGRPLPRANDGMSSLSAGLVSLLHSLVFRPVELSAFVWAYHHFNIITLPWNSPYTWCLTLTGVDFAYYWVHRFGHEVNIIWASHQTHHSSQDYNFTTALRQSAFQKYFSWVFYMPLALFLPPSIFLVHIQLNLLYQFWVHTEVVKSLGFLEYIICTPSHHRVHHGRNQYCIDKNYGGVLIIWDRIFGTFEAERPNEEIAYGLVHSLNSWSLLYTQFCHLKYILSRLTEVKSVFEGLGVLFKGPGWAPGKPRLGLPEDIPQVECPVEKYNRLSVFMIYIGLVFIVVSLTSFGAQYDNRWYAGWLECARCSAALLYLWITWSQLYLVYPSMALQTVLVLYLVSAIAWGVVSITQAAHKSLRGNIPKKYL
ncbi:alkylglycerol monooxygenase-like isoform X2 [Liolophura sinensis]|uniref:alkylglycerol monooxygenase-like isoform X2 n=1 Tax=Liolophura sinensis TaxID=3198878 RepID=UPI0031586DE1